MVTGWYANRDAPNQQATAARAHGMAYRHADPVEAFEALNRLTVINNTRVAIAVGDSLADLLADGSNEIAGHVLAGLAESARDRERSPAVQLAFLILAAPLDKEVPAELPGRISRQLASSAVPDGPASPGAAVHRVPVAVRAQRRVLPGQAERVMTDGRPPPRATPDAPGVPADRPGDR